MKEAGAYDPYSRLPFAYQGDFIVIYVLYRVVNRRLNRWLFPEAAADEHAETEKA